MTFKKAVEILTIFLSTHEVHNLPDLMKAIEMGRDCLHHAQKEIADVPSLP
ncbi:hypothetical protein ES703_88185 [subsurface metagenome]